MATVGVADRFSEMAVSSKMTIACDLDGVLADIHTITLTEISAEIQQVLTLNLVTEWDWSPAGFNGSIIDRWQHFWRDHSGESVQPHERDLETITRRIRRRFGGLDVVTQHSELERKNIEWWLRNHGVQYDKLVLVGLRGKEDLPYVV